MQQTSTSTRRHGELHCPAQFGYTTHTKTQREVLMMIINRKQKLRSEKEKQGVKRTSYIIQSGVNVIGICNILGTQQILGATASRHIEYFTCIYQYFFCKRMVSKE